MTEPTPHPTDPRPIIQAMIKQLETACACPKMDDGLSCVPLEMRDAWFAYTGPTGSNPTQMERE